MLFLDWKRSNTTDMLDDGFPAPIIVDLIAVPRSIDNVQLQTNAILNDDVRLLVDLGRGSSRTLEVESAFGIDEVRGKERVD